MKYIKDTVDFNIEENTVLSLGKFDGVHRGHDLLLENLFQKKKEGLSAAIFTFNIPPRQNVEHAMQHVLTTNEEKMHLLEQLGVDYLIECPFTREIMCMEAQDFVRKIVKELHVKCFVVGDDFHFGHNRCGDYHMLRDMAEELGYEVIVVKKIKEDERDISSTFVREEVELGHIEKANHLLGYPYFVCGKVEHGKEIGRTIGIPTINLLPPKEKLLPPFGVYVSKVLIDGKEYHGVTNVGRKPTIAGENPVGVETHILDVAQDLYGKEVKVEFLKFVRPEQKFDSVESLKNQMQQDVATAERFFQK
ncbi:MAG: bifunctional riboflavin kinase/FAD synthetase [Roseburia sp.]|uniref:bifunctional riboflavin kinase/FAD synthetase n=1 Tax=Roseburia sp. 831b TaxID=1261635 RepID=UPI0009512CE2|nr:bifunctional riboflavin kinase/FAD synthetase [Roseburia sp. 831b]MDD6216680.1 bifunctional riboflavin kinase/FAD synthetase [Roseburia sp.]MDY5883667.1 bifunctional riboflavin kinase/FAD synthetase [Roseburia sp.]WVK74056.1 bifunctional riboflavin kinase/FAD synthetase [Roseburia sp. 831b]